MGGTALPTDAGIVTINNCGDLICRGAGRCVIDNGAAQCVCDSGYLLDENGEECLVDEECIKLKILEQGCRQRTAAEPALGMFFGVETCAGTAVLPGSLGDLSEAFVVSEDGNALGEESYATVFERDVESFIAIALDFSSSVTNDRNLLEPLIEELKDMLTSLEPAAGQPAVSVALIVFGRTISTAQAFTQDFGQLAATLDALQAEPNAAVVDPAGTNLNGAVNDAVVLTQQAMDARFGEANGAVVSTGTVVTITDGRDTGGTTLTQGNPQINRISIGISADIDDNELTSIGPDGSFLAPESNDWADAFNRVATRVKQYPDRAYLLGYCSPTVGGSHTVRVSLAGRPTEATATCDFNAGSFGVGAGLCNEASINNYCSSRTCASFLACGECDTPDGGIAEDDTWVFD